jgi:predicted RecB family nuclease
MSTKITASMLYSFTTCPHRVHLDLFGDPAQRDEVSPFVELLWERGHLFEKETIESLGLPFLNLRIVPREEREEQTLRAMCDGVDLIYGGRISHGSLLGEPDLLRRTDSRYEPGDIKSGAGLEGATEDTDGKPKRQYAVQLALYADILRRKGLTDSERAFVWDIRGDEVPYDLSRPRTKTGKRSMWDEYIDVLASVEEITARQAETRPGLISACSLCHWRTHCQREIVDADDLTLIPELGPGARKKFPPSIATVSDLADAHIEALLSGGKSTIPGIGERSLRKLHARAVLQKQPSSGAYFTDPVRLPKLAAELFFDVETDPFRGLCYLHGFLERTKEAPERYVAFFADEAFEEAEHDAFADAWAYVQGHPDAVVYYYSHYERTTWRKLAGRYPNVASENEVLALFAEERFVDLYADVVKSRMIWPTTSHSLKVLATSLGFHWRDTDPSGAASIQWFHEWVEGGDPAIRQRILDYNEDDCRATRVLVDAIRRTRKAVPRSRIKT